jgi:peptidoglycan/xylan/chitin deacetylase (PgdA/CDA1 family)
VIQAACFAPQALQAVSGEQVPQKFGRAQSVRIPGADDGAPVPPQLRGAIRRVDLPAGSRKLIALTLDFCEQSSEVAGYDGAIIDILRRERVKATMFMGGKYMVSHLVRTQQMMSDSLFEIGTHGWIHRNTRGLTGIDLKREILAPSGAYAAARTSLAQAQCAAPLQAAMSQVPVQPRLYRFPFGACNAEGMNTANDAGLLAIQWDLSTGDPSPSQSARAIAQQMIANTRPGSIIIAHANGRGHHTAEALPQAIAALRAKGFEFVTVSELIAAGKPVVVSTCYDSHPGDTDKYDAFFKPRTTVTPTAALVSPTRKSEPAYDLRSTFPR